MTDPEPIQNRARCADVSNVAAALPTKPWLDRDRLPLRLMPPDTDLMEMIPSATEAAEYKSLIANPSKLDK